MESEEEEDQKPDTATTSKKLQVAEVSLICTGWRRKEDYGEPRRFINMNFPLDDDEAFNALDLSVLQLSVPLCTEFKQVGGKLTHYTLTNADRYHF